MTVNVSPRPRAETELDRAIRTLKENYERAQRQNALHPGIIRKPLAWALYRTWRGVDAMTKEW